MVGGIVSLVWPFLLAPKGALYTGGGNPPGGDILPPLGVISPPNTDFLGVKGGGYPYPLFFFRKKAGTFFLVIKKCLEINVLKGRSHVLRIGLYQKAKKKVFLP